MSLVLVTAPTKEPVSLPEMKLHLRVDGADDDELIASLIVAARDYVETVTGRKLLAQTWDYALSDWPACDAIVLPFGTLQSVTSVVWKDTTGASTTLTAGSDYLVETNGTDRGRIVLPYGGVWPSGTLYPSNPITVRFVCGATSELAVPFPLKAAIKLYVTKLYESRGDDTVGTTVAEDTTLAKLLPPYRLWGV